MCIRATALGLAFGVSITLAAELTLPPRAVDAITGREFAARIATLDLAARETATIAEIQRGNVPDFWRHFVDVKLDGDATISVAPDYLAIGSDEDYFLTPLSPASAQAIADQL